MQIEFTSRYGPSGPPSWLRGCQGDCEAMGWVPVFAHEPSDPNMLDPIRPCLSSFQEREIRRLINEGRGQSDGWYFIRCHLCAGTGRCSWLVTIARIPRWLVRGVSWCWYQGPGSTTWRGHPFSYSRKAWLTFKIAFLCDLGWRI